VIAGKTVVQRVYENAITAGGNEIIVATDDQRIIDEIDKFNGTAMMTSIDHRTGTDRIAEVCHKKGWSDDTIIVNLQGDEPGIGAELIKTVALALADNKDAGIATLATPITDSSDLFNPNAVKVVCGINGMALYFSRAPIPYVRDAFSGSVPEQLPEDTVFLRHLGLYAYRVGALRSISQHQPVKIEQAESLEQLRAMAMGIKIHVSVTDKSPGHGVDTEDDLKRVEKIFKKSSADSINNL
jgi:3-deoxy-manno-octulosonate cytidylyltransferase (CMP-KDO synthetase)